MSTFFLISIFGILFDWRTVIYFERKSLIDVQKTKSLPWITVFKLILLVLAPVLFLRHHFVFILVTFISIVPAAIYDLCLQMTLNRKKFLEDGFAVDLLLISIKSGKSFREAFSELKMKTMADKMHFTTSIGTHCEALQKSPDRVVERLKALKFKIEIENKLRHKSRQALLQTKIQAWIVLFLYLMLVLLIEDYRNHPFEQPSLIISSLFVTAGIFWIQRMGKKIQWKV